jgi:hypothetical protein
MQVPPDMAATRKEAILDENPRAPHDRVSLVAVTLLVASLIFATAMMVHA